MTSLRNPDVLNKVGTIEMIGPDRAEIDHLTASTVEKRATLVEIALTKECRERTPAPAIDVARLVTLSAIALSPITDLRGTTITEAVMTDGITEEGMVVTDLATETTIAAISEITEVVIMIEATSAESPEVP